MSDITKEQMKRALPKGVRIVITDELLDTVNNSVKDPAEREMFKDNIIGYIGVMSNGKFRIADYVTAVKYVGYKLMGDTNITAYAKTFPKRYQYFVDQYTEDRHIAGHVSIYNRGALVNKIYEQTLIPCHILNQDLHQRAINKLADLMMNAKSEKVQSDSAAKLVDVLKIPETLKVELDIGLKEDDSIKELRASTMELVAQQRLMIEAGAMNAKQVAHSKLIIDVEVEEAEEVN